MVARGSFGIGSAHAWDPGAGLAGRLQEVPRSGRWLLPALAAAFRGTESSTIEPRTRALLLLRVASVDRSAYWRLQLEPAARELGVSDDELALVESDEWESMPTLSDRERAAVLWGDRVARRMARRDMKAYERVRTVFGDEEIIELTLVASLAAMADRFANALRIPSEGPIGLSPEREPVAESALAHWTERMFDPRWSSTETGAVT
jgi:alkylhydroperoxidase family enzyme